VKAFERITEFLETKSGHVFRERGRQRLQDTLERRMAELGLHSLEEYAKFLEGGGGQEEWQRLLSEMTIKESYLFRGPAQWGALANSALPSLIRTLPEHGGELLAWSAACARGEEAATLAMVLAEVAEEEPFLWRIIATDVDRGALDASRLGHFRQRAVRNVPARLAKKYLEPESGGFRLAQRLRERIEFRWLNLAETPWPFPSGGFQIVLLRNVLIYFGEESLRRVIREARRVLSPGGWLFVGPTESLWGSAEGLQAINLGNCFAYRHKENPSLLRHAPLPRAAGRPQGGEGERLRLDSEVLRRPVSGTEASGVSAVVRLLGEGRIEDALAMATHLLEGSGGRAEIHALAGICHDRLGETGGAIEGYRAALYLEPGLFQVHWLLARCLEKEGWPDAARREYRTVMEQSHNPTVISLAFGEALGLPSAPEAGRRAAAALQGTSHPSAGRHPPGE